MKNKIICLMCLSVVLFSLTGCVFNRNSPRRQIIKYMEDKYDDDFTYEDSFGGDSKTVNALLRSDKFSGVITASRSVDEYGQVHYTDNYVMCKYESETNEFLLKFAKKLFGSQVKVYYALGSLGNKNNFTGKTTFEEFLKSERNSVSFTIVVGSDYKVNEEKVINDLKLEIGNAEFYFRSFDVYFAPNDEMFVDYFKIKYFEREQYKRVFVSENFSEIEWRDYGQPYNT